jgi:hypothetical protein
MNNLLRPSFGAFPPACSCGCDPCQCQPFPPEWAKFGFRLRECFREIEQFKCLIAEIIKELNASGCGVINGPIQGVIDGSNARQGQVGEYVTGSASFAFAATGMTTVNLSPIVLQPGDWNVTGYLAATVPYSGGGFLLAPQPTGMSNDLAGTNWQQTVVGQTESDVILSKTARGSFSTPTLLPFSATINQGTSGFSAGSATLTIEARRMR